MDAIKVTQDKEFILDYPVDLISSQGLLQGEERQERETERHDKTLPAVSGFEDGGRGPQPPRHGEASRSWKM